MRLPDDPRVLPNGLVCRPKEIDRGAWQAHLLKHPLGIAQLILYQGNIPWNEEGWDQLEPPVVTQAVRDALFQAIAALSGCGLPEIRGEIRSDPDCLPCYHCDGAALVECERLLASGTMPSVGPGYAGVTQEILDGVTSASARVVRRSEIWTRVTSLLGAPAALAGLSVASAGTDTQGRLLFRVSRHDGVRTEFYLKGSKLEWRTTYRNVLWTAKARESFLLQMLTPTDRAGDLSDKCIVPRQWWENHED